LRQNLLPVVTLTAPAFLSLKYCTEIPNRLYG
jgi:hypothetical protein